MAQVCGLGPRVGGRMVLFCIHHVNRVYGALVHGRVTAPYKLSYYHHHHHHRQVTSWQGSPDECSKAVNNLSPNIHTIRVTVPVVRSNVCQTKRSNKATCSRIVQCKMMNLANK